MADRFLSERLSPILVKELRQGIKAHLFSGALIVLQILMLLALATSLAAGTGFQEQILASAVFWTMIGLPVLLLMPMSGVRAVSGEVQAKTLEPILLTRLSAHRIVAGKWAAIVGETLLLVSTVLPYLVLRYFTGGIDIWRDLLGLLAMVGVSAFLSAVTVGLSATRVTGWLKWGGVALLGVFLLRLGPLLLMSTATMGGLGLGVRPFLVAAVFGVLMIVLLLEVGTISIAPPAENHATRLRILALLALILGGLSMFLLSEVQGLVWLLAVLIVAPICIGSLCEPIKPIASLYAPFMTRRLPGRLVVALLCPGWPGGVLFTTAAATGLGALLIVWSNWGGSSSPRFVSPWSAACVVMSLIGAFLFPLALVRRFLSSTPRVLAMYLLVAMGTASPVYLFGAGKILNKSWLIATGETLSAFLPLSYAVFAIFEHSIGVHRTLWENTFLLAVSVGSVLAVALQSSGGWRELARIAGSSPRSAEPTLTSPLAQGSGHERTGSEAGNDATQP